MSKPSYDPEKHPLWKECNEVAEFIFVKQQEIHEDFKWDVAHRLRGASTDLIYSLAQAAASANPNAAEYDWGNAIRAVSVMKTMYRFAGRQKMLELDPEMMVRLTKLIDTLTRELDKAEGRIKDKRLEEDAEWLKRQETLRASEKDGHEN